MAFDIGGLLGKFIPESYGLTDQDKRALARQGLLSSGLAMLASQSGGNFGQSFGEGLQSGLLAINKGADNIGDQRQRQQMMAAQNGAPAQQRYLEWLASKLPEGEQQEAYRVAAGTQGRASSSGYSFDKFTDANGNPRPQRNNPRTGESEIYVDESGQWVPLGGGQSAVPARPASVQLPPQAQAAQMGQAVPGNYAADFTTLAGEFPGISMTSGTRTAQRNAEVGGQPNSQHLRGTAADYAVPPQLKPAFVSRAKQLGYQAIDEGDHIHLQLPRGQSVAGLGIGVGRSKEQEAAAVKAAERNVELGTLAPELGMRTQAALNQAAGIKQIDTAADFSKTAATRQRDAGTALGLLDEAERLLPNATGSRVGSLLDTVSGAFGTSTEGAKATAALKAISGQLTSKMPRMEGPQSDKDVQLYKEMAGDLSNDTLPVQTRMAALQQIRRLNQKYSGQKSPASPPAPGTIKGGYRFRGGNPADKNNWERI